MGALEPAQRVARAEVGVEEDVGVSEGAQRDVVGGPRTDARQLEQASADGVAVVSTIEDDDAIGQGAAEAGQGTAPGARHRQVLRVDRGEHVHRREEVGQSGDGRADLGAVLDREPRGDGARTGHADLLAQHRAYGDLVAVDMSGHAQARGLPDQRSEDPVLGERVGHGHRIAVGVEQASRPLHRRRGVAQVGEGELGPDEGGRAHLRHVWQREPDGAGPVRQGDGAGVRLTLDHLDARDGAQGEEVEQLGAGVGGAHGQPHHHAPSATLGRPRRPRSSVGETAYTSRTVSLNWRMLLKPGGERHVGEAHVGGLDQDPRGLRAARPGQRQRAGAELVGEQPPEVTGRVADPGREPVHALPVDEPVGDEPHRAARDIGSDIPVGAARSGVGQAPLAGPEARRLAGRRGRSERYVGEAGRPGRAARAAVDPGGGDARVEHAVEPAVLALDRPVAGLGIEVGASHGNQSGGDQTPLLAGIGHGGGGR